MSSFQIFKVNHLIDKNKIDTIYVFYGSNLDVDEDIDLTELFKVEPTNKLFNNIFTQEELQNIKDKDIDVEFLNEAIHIDDTIGIIKLKIVLALGIRTTIDELYLYSLKKEKLLPSLVYQMLTQNDTITLTYERLQSLLLNIRDKYGKPIDFLQGKKKKEKYIFEDILELGLETEEYYVTKVLGQKFFMVTNEYPYIIDPYYLEEYDPLLEQSNKEITTLNSHLLLNNGEIINNNIYLCTAENVLGYLDSEGISEDYCMKIYYPFLYRRDIKSLDELEINKRKLISENKALLNEQMIRSFKNVDMFYDIYKTKTESDRFSLIKKKTGIKSFRITLYPDSNVKIPVDVIFKLLHATQSIPLIKFNPSTRQENIYRLFVDDISTDGRKIPYLPKAMIFKLIKAIGKTRSVATFIRINKTDILICEFHDDASISIYSVIDFESPIMLGETSEDKFNLLDGIIRNAINPVIEQIRPFFEQSGYKINNFKTITSNLVEIDEMVYQTAYKITTPIEINKFSGCITSIFNIESNNFKKGLELRYKRVSNFNKRDSQEAFVIEKQKQGYNANEIIDLLVENYDDMDKSKATELLQKIISELQVERGVKRKAIEIKINPGFKTNFTYVPISGELTIQMHSIDNIYYLDTVPIFLNSLIRITQDKSSSAFATDYINQLCSANEIEDIRFNDIIAESEEAVSELPEGESLSSISYPEETEQERSEYNKQARMNELLDIFGYEEGEGEKNYYEYEGGKPSSDSSSSNIKISSDFSLGSLVEPSLEENESTRSSEKTFTLSSNQEDKDEDERTRSSEKTFTLSSNQEDEDESVKSSTKSNSLSNKIKLNSTPSSTSSGIIKITSSSQPTSKNTEESEDIFTEKLISLKERTSTPKSSSSLIRLKETAPISSASIKEREPTPASSSSLISLEEIKERETTPVSSESLISLEETIPIKERESTPESLISLEETKSIKEREPTPVSSESLISLEKTIPIKERETTPVSSESLISLEETMPIKERESTPASSESLISLKEKETTPGSFISLKETTLIQEKRIKSDDEFLSDSDEEEEIREPTPEKTINIEVRTPTPEEEIISIPKTPLQIFETQTPFLEEEEEEIIPISKKPTVVLEEEEEEIIPISKKPTVVLEEEEEIIPISKKPTVVLEEEEDEYIDVAPKISTANIKKIEELKKNLGETVRDITGTQLNNPYFFQDRMEKRDPGLFVTMKEGSMMAYSRMCPSNVKRQPVILTEEEKNELINEHPDLYSNPRKIESDFVEYRFNEDNPEEKYFYTCPRYWCLLTDKMVTKKQIMDGECGGVKYDEKTYQNAIIPKNAKKVPKGQYVYQFYDEGVEHFPGFHKENTQDGNCIPCCYTKWNTAAVKERRDKCQAQSKEMIRKRLEPESEEESKTSELDEEEEVVVVPQTKPVNIKSIITGKEQYIKGPEVYPLGSKRWGFLPVAIERLLHESNATCQISQTNTNIKVNHPCLLRHGVENSMTQSFIACIASALFYAESVKNENDEIIPRILMFDPEAQDDVPSIAKMKQLIINAMTLDSFITYQNGDLITTFANDSLDIDMNYVSQKYGETKLYNKLRKYSSLSSETSSLLDSSTSQILIASNNNTSSSVAQEAISIGGATNSSSSTLTISESDENNNEEKFVLHAVKAFETFKKFLDPKNTSNIVDHTYLWDIVTRPNPKLFNSGFNLVIFEITDNDITNNVELLCPTNHYSNQVYVARRKTLILIKRENTFEPIYSYLDTGKKLKVVKMFSEYDPTLAETSKSMRAVLNTIIKPLLSNQCAALPSLASNLYKFKSPPTLSALIKQLDKRRYIIETQVVNFQGKVIGVLAESRSGLRGYIPCYPSSLCVPKYPNKGKECRFGFIYMDEVQWQPYKETMAFLKEFYRYEEPQSDESNKYVKCNEGTDLCKVIEDHHIVGILTNTNQFVQISEVLREDEISDNIRTVNSSNYLLADEETLLNQKEDAKRVEYIRRIQLETNFYNVFRNTIRILLGDYLNNDKRKIIQQECNKRFALYDAKLKTVIKLLEDLVGDNIIFSDSFNVKSVKDIYTCLNIDENKCNVGNSVCFMTNDKCTLVLPNINLITRQPTNKEQYYGKMADELIRYNRIKSYIFKSKAFLSFNKLGYNLRDDEIIILQSLITQEFFEGLVSSNKNKFAKYNSYDTTNPIKSLPYVNEYKMDAIINPHELNECERSTVGKISSLYWRQCFPTSYKERSYFGLNDCTFNIVVDIIAKIKGQQIQIEKLRNILNDEYYRLTKGFSDKQNIQKIADILSEEGKKLFADQIVQQILSFTEMVYTYSYFITNFDLWILLNYFKIPSIFISNVNIPETRYNEKQFVVYTDDNIDKFVFIITPGLREKNVPEYKIIIDEKEQIVIPLNSIKPHSECINKINDAIRSYVSIDEYLNIYKRDNKYKYVKKRKDERKKPIAMLEEGALLEEETPIIKEEKPQPQIVFEEEDNSALIKKPEEPQINALPEVLEEEEIIPVKAKPRRRKPVVNLVEEEEEIEVPVKKEEVIVNKPFVAEPKEEFEEIIPIVRKRNLTKKKVEIRPQERKKLTRKALPTNLILEEVDEL